MMEYLVVLYFIAVWAVFGKVYLKYWEKECDRNA